MNTIKFNSAKGIFYPYSSEKYAETMKEESVGQYGFYYALDLSEYAGEDGELTLSNITARITGRNMYRLYINGEIIMHGPARTAHGYCRVDEIDVTWFLCPGINHIAIELLAYGNEHPIYGRYSNDSTLEAPFLTAEIVSGDKTLCATGRDDFKVCRIESRVTSAERISHCRESIEIYNMDDQYYLWKEGKTDFISASVTEEEPVYILHEALKPSLEESFFDELLGFGSCYIDESIKTDIQFFENTPAYHSLSEHPATDCKKTVDVSFGGVEASYCDEGLKLSGDENMYALFDGKESRVGFIRIAFTCEKAGTVDIVHSEMIDTDGSIPYYYNVVARLHVNEGMTDFISIEPSLARYIKVYFRGVGEVTLHSLSILDYSYTDEHKSSFLCSDENINALYNAAKKTLLLNTLDIFMDCPDRERGGWLCDSLWTARAASLLLSDNRVEREYLETFLLTPADGMFHGFFPEVYPALKSSYKDMTGITTWSFWLGCQICEYINRTADYAFRDEFAPRIEAFVKGSMDFIGKSGVLENLPWIFIDWSLSNNPEYNSPVSTPANALYAYMLIQLGNTFSHPEWTEKGEEIRKILRSAMGDASNIKYIPDSFDVDEIGNLRSKGKHSETAMCTSLWCGLVQKGEAPLLEKTVRDKMGPAPLYAKDPLVGSSQLFIGLCIRLDMLCRLGNYDKMFEDMLKIYMPQIKEGPGTLWETEDITTSSRCHGFASHAGVHLMRDVLGIGIPTRKDGKAAIDIAPHICGLRWAKGTHSTPCGLIALEWRYDGESFYLGGSIPKGYEYTLTLPKEVKALDSDKVKINIVVRG